MNTSAPSVTLTTPRQPGAVALLQVHGPGVGALLQQLTDRRDWPAGQVRLVGFADIDAGLAVRLRDDWAQLMPHGGLRVVQRLIDRLIALGAQYDAEPAATALYPEAGSAIEADALATIARAASPAAIDLLANQPALWRIASPANNSAVLARSIVLDRLLAPPTVVVVGRANVGKSTLTNAVLGKAVSVVADLPGTTRDWVGALAELCGRSTAPAANAAHPEALAVAVHWMDTPGLRAEAERVERRAIDLARQVLEQADVLIAMRDPATDWPEPTDLPRSPDVWVMNKVDDAPTCGKATRGRGDSPTNPLSISAEHDRNLDGLSQRVLEALELDTLSAHELWAFSPTLRRHLEGESVDLAAYLADRTTV